MTKTSEVKKRRGRTIDRKFEGRSAKNVPHLSDRSLTDFLQEKVEIKIDPNVANLLKSAQGSIEKTKSREEYCALMDELKKELDKETFSYIAAAGLSDIYEKDSPLPSDKLFLSLQDVYQKMTHLTLHYVKVDGKHVKVERSHNDWNKEVEAVKRDLENILVTLDSEQA